MSHTSGYEGREDQTEWGWEKGTKMRREIPDWQGYGAGRGILMIEEDGGEGRREGKSECQEVRATYMRQLLSI